MRRLQSLLEVLGAGGVAGLGVVLFCVNFYFTAVAPSERELRAQAIAEGHLGSRSPDQRAPAGTGAAPELQHFHSLFPPIDRLGAELETLYAQARKAKLDLLQGEYRLDARAPGLAAYRVTLPIRGTYPQVRKFIGAVLKEIPTASVDVLRFERKSVADTQLEAQVQLTLYFRSPADTSLEQVHARP